ncbi:hypothetical protein MAPG_05606 [Magnaporthiopsis poae ATCC 64411]|uniref:Uncharacterized protein n=1 Tax=Magnaporthiopsis poae (strain ATCC 64411 / 73-15) TaxID=644358 RepID=A0A0C4DZU8_MAGP6|nr:hypothetical protein MAPG_05606 [Magnaporthiopsis poae ATCC 64411]
MPAMQTQQPHTPLATGPPPLLYTKRLSGFLQSSLSPQIHSAIVTTLSGKLLAYASRHPVSTLRTQCTWRRRWFVCRATGVAAAAAAVTTATAGPASAHVERPADGAEREGPSTAAGEQQPHTASALPAAAPATDGGGSNLAPQASASAAVVGSPSETTSVLSGTSAAPSTTATATSVGVAAAGLTRRHAEELARWLDERLETLWVPDESGGSALDVR